MSETVTPRSRADLLGSAYVGLALGAPTLGMLILSVGVFAGRSHGGAVAWWATLVAFPVLVVALSLIVPLTRSDRT